MCDFRDAKVMAQTLREALSARQVTLTHSESLELVAKILGLADWNGLSAATKAAEAKPEEPPAPMKPVDNNHALDGVARAPGPLDGVARVLGLGRWKGRVDHSASLQATIHRAVGLATARKQSLTTLEHLLLALTDDEDAAEVMRACEVNLAELRQRLVSYLDNELKALATGDVVTTPTAGFERVLQRAAIHVQSAGRDEVTAPNVLVAIFSERESHAAYFLKQEKMNRYDAVNFIAHGVRKHGRAA